MKPSHPTTARQKPSPTIQKPSPQKHKTDPNRKRKRSPPPPLNMYTFASRPRPATPVVDLTAPSPPRRTAAPPRTKTASNPHAGAKKLVVLHPRPQWDPQRFLQTTWSQLDAAVTAILDDRPDDLRKEELYRAVENACRQGGAATFASRLDARLQTHMADDVVARVSQLDDDNVALVRAVLDQWTRWKRQMATIRGIFFFLDRSYLLTSKKPTLSERTPQLFCDLIFHHSDWKEKIVDGTCDIVATGRDHPDRTDIDALFQAAVDMFYDLSVYTEAWEPTYLSRTQHYLAPLSEQLIRDTPLPRYVATAEAIIASEQARCERFHLSASTKRDIFTLLEDHLVERHVVALTAPPALAPLLTDNATDDLAALYALLDRRRLGHRLRPAFAKWLDDTGTAIVFADHPDDMVVHLLSLKRRMDVVWRQYFHRDEELGHCLRETFAVFMNKTKKADATWGTDNTKVGEMIAKYVDLLLRGGAKAIPAVLTGPPRPAPDADHDEPDADSAADEDAEMDVQLDQVLDLFRFVQGKAVFEAFYKKDLARRLLLGRSASAAAERSMLTRLKTECGAAFTHNLEQMFADVERARDDMAAFRHRRRPAGPPLAIDLSVHVLSAAAWPSYPDLPVSLPPDVRAALAEFEAHYRALHAGRRLAWKHAHAHAQLRARFPLGAKELLVSGFQAVVLLLFNGPEDRLSYPHILHESGLRTSISPPNPPPR